MTYNKKALGPVISFLVWLLLFGIVCIVGISNVFAATYPISMTSEVAFYDNSGSSLTSIGTNWMESMQAYYSNNLPTTAGSYGGAIAFNSPIPLLANHTYALTLTFDNDDIDIALSLKNKIAIGNSISSVKYNYEQGNYYNELVYSNIANKSTLQFSFKTASNGNASYILIPWTTKTNMNKAYYFNQIIIDDLGTTSVTQDQINSSLNNQTNVINNSITNSENNIKNSIKDSEDNIKDGIKQGFESCRDSYNLFNLNSNFISNGSIFTTNVSNDNLLVINSTGSSKWHSVRTTLSGFKANTNYSFSISSKSSSLNVPTVIVIFNSKNERLCTLTDKLSCTFNSGEFTSFSFYFYPNYGVDTTEPNTATFSSIMLNEGSSSLPYEEYGQTICSNRIDDTNKKLDEQNKTSKGILGKLKDLLSYINPFSDNFFVYKLIELLIDALKSLFIPKDGFFMDWWNDFKSYMNLKLGFLTKPIDIFISFISGYLNLSDSNIIINIPDITVPNFEDHIIIHSQSFNWKELLQSKTSLNNLWQLYLDFIDVFLIFNFIGLCESVYARIFGGDTSNYEYYTVDDSYYYDNSTGEVSGASKHSERTTFRKKVR